MPQLARLSPLVLLMSPAVLLVPAGCGTPPPPPPVLPTAAPSPPPRPTPTPRRRSRPPKPKVRVPFAASGEYVVVRGGAPARPGRGAVVRYLVEVERGLPFDPETFAAAVHRTLNDVRGWARFRRVDHGPVQVRVALSSPGLTIRECLPLHTGGELSCWNGTRSIINARRWAEGVPQYEGDLAAYRHYVINHEVGHSLGHSHLPCPGPGRLAPVMTQQSKSLGRCRPNPWPFPSRRPDDPDQADARRP
ncbi:DUF3152 domain-containing protein [Nonomuraea jiangxiensis]|uniref:DUF3152 domain-containing protein n=1 Tax=Nonomuraea jiangxiensis TaxID=633440 RepID=A0A1G8K9Y6_9ACTN|nr:DUF3152 domain-containing protein [Nonomuraea jiangxiensis]SDI40268.1 Protein of unknown function [Nonomuraea jiangxiensis]